MTAPTLVEIARLLAPYGIAVPLGAPHGDYLAIQVAGPTIEGMTAAERAGRTLFALGYQVAPALPGGTYALHVAKPPRPETGAVTVAAWMRSAIGGGV